MKTDQTLKLLGAHFGVVSSYRDLARKEHPTNPDTQKALLRANGLVLESERMIAEALADVQAHEQSRLFPLELIVQSCKAQTLSVPGVGHWQLVNTENASPVAEGKASAVDLLDLPALQSGVYELLLQGNAGYGVTTLIVAPDRAPSLRHTSANGKNTRQWGITAALYALRSSRNSGIGDFADLARLAEIVAGEGAAFVGINPVHAIGVAATDVFSPYSPSHRGFVNSTHIALDAIPGLSGSMVAKQIVEEVRRISTVQKTEDFIDYPVCKSAHGKALQALYRCFSESAEKVEQQAFADFQSSAGEHLADFALYEAISQQHGPDFQEWPPELRDKKSAAIKQTRQTLAGELPFYYWLQWVATNQLSDAQSHARHAGMSLGLYLDLAVGARRSGAESWCEIDAIASGVSVGAPPDHLSPAGQNWNLAAFAPVKLRAQKYNAFRRVIRAAIQHAGVLRIDHVLGLNRSFWIPDDGSPGAYIRQPFEALIAIVKIEAERAGTIIIGEDLGLVPEGFRETMRAHGFYGYSVLQFEKNSAGEFRNPETCESQILACFSTHDTATLSGYEHGSDIAWWHKLGWINEDAVDATKTARATDVAAIRNLVPGDFVESKEKVTFNTSVHSLLARSPAALISVQLDDLLGNTEAQNLPGTIEEHPNWRRRYNISLECLLNDPGLGRVAECIRRWGR